MSDQSDEETEETELDPHDPPREITHGRGPGQGVWLEHQLKKALEKWGYAAARREPVVALTADVVACRGDHRDEPADYLVAECKDWESRSIDESVIIRLCLLAFLGRAMPVLCHTTRLTDRAWRLAQAFDVRLLTLRDLEGDELPPLTCERPPEDADVHRTSVNPWSLRTTPPVPLLRMHAGQPVDIETPVFFPNTSAPCYVPDRTGHEDYTDTHLAQLERREHHRRHAQGDE